MSALKTIGQDLTGLLLFVGLVILFLAGEFIEIPSSLLSSGLANVTTIFLSILLEAIPFILIGVFASALIQVFVSEKTLQRLIPKRFPYLAIFPAAIVGAILPVCECAIVPVARRLMRKGVPPHLALVIMVTAPILNPIVFASTYYAFQPDWTIVWGRMVIGFVAAVVIAGAWYRLFNNRDPLLKGTGPHQHHHEQGSKLMLTLTHASNEFFDMGKFLIIGALVAAIFQTFLDRELLVGIGSHALIGPAVMMIFAYVISLCSEADAFVASSFGSLFTASSLLAFLVYGPMIDFKNTLLMLSYFKKRYVVAFILIVTVVVYACAMLIGILT